MTEWLEKQLSKTKSQRLAEAQERPKGQKCSNCLHHCGHYFSPKYHYCKLGKSKHTPNGFAKTTASGWCQKWEDGKAKS